MVDDSINTELNKAETLLEPPIEVKLKQSIGRPSIFNQTLADKICHELALGKSMRTVCAPDDMPAMSTVFSWFRTNKEFLEQYTRAKEESTDALAEEVLDIADDGTNDFMAVKGIAKPKYNREAVERSKLRVDTRKWLMSKMKPKKYADKMDVTSGGEKIEGNSIIFSNFKANETSGE